MLEKRLIKKVILQKVRGVRAEIAKRQDGGDRFDVIARFFAVVGPVLARSVGFWQYAAVLCARHNKEALRRGECARKLRKGNRCAASAHASYRTFIEAWRENSTASVITALES